MAGRPADTMILVLVRTSVMAARSEGIWNEGLEVVTSAM